MPPTLKDVADLAKVSLTTASHALNGKKVNEQTRQRVLEAAKKLRYYVNVSGRNLITRKTNNLCMTIINSSRENNISEEFSYYYPMLIGAMKYAQSMGYSMRFETVLWEELEKNEYFEQKVYGRSDDGIIVIPKYKNRCDFVRMFDEDSYPYVFINPWSEVEDKNIVMLDNYYGGRIAAEYISKQRHKRILFINGPEDHISATNIERGFLDELLHRGIRFNKADIIYSDFTHEGGYYVMKKVLSDSKQHPTFIFCANDYMATGVISALHESGKNIPNDISVMGFDGREASKFMFPRLTTVYADTMQMGFEAAKRLITLMNKPDEISGLKPVVIYPNLITRNTVMKL